MCERSESLKKFVWEFLKNSLDNFLQKLQKVLHFTSYTMEHLKKKIFVISSGEIFERNKKTDEFLKVFKKIVVGEIVINLKEMFGRFIPDGSLACFPRNELL